MSKYVRTGKIIEPRAVGGSIYETVTIFTGPTSYDTGGSTIEARDLGFAKVIFAQIICISADQIVNPVFTTAEKQSSIKGLMTDLAGTQVSSTTDKSGKTFIVKAIGIQ